MRLKFWGSWFLAIACLAVCLTMGCEKGVLGVKPAIVRGKIVGIEHGELKPLEGATVRLMSKETTALGDGLEQGANFLMTTTNSLGDFIFENVKPDNIVLTYEFGENTALYPPKESKDDDDDEGGSTEVNEDLESVFVHSGDIVDVGDLKLWLRSGMSSEVMTLKLDLVNKLTHKQLTDEAISVEFGGQVVSKTADELRKIGLEVKTNTVEITIKSEKNNFQEKIEKIAVSKGMTKTIELEPYFYRFVISAKDNFIPAYMLKMEKDKAKFVHPIKIQAEIHKGNGIEVITNSDTSVPTNQQDGFLTGGKDPTVFFVPAVAEQKLYLRIQVHGYEDELVKISTSDLQRGTRSNYALFIDFLGKDNVKNETEFTSSGDIVCLANNIKKRNVELTVQGDRLKEKTGSTEATKIRAYTNLPCGEITYASTSVGATDDLNDDDDENYGHAIADGGPIVVKFNAVPTGYNMLYWVDIKGSRRVDCKDEDGIPIPIGSGTYKLPTLELQ